MVTRLNTLFFVVLSSFATMTQVAIAQNASSAMNHTFTAELQEVRTGSVNGREYLTIQIDTLVGPANCQGSKLRVDTLSVEHPAQQEAMESIALEAMLTSERVVITVPLTSDECVDGMPTLTSINLVTQIPYTDPADGFENSTR